MQFMNPQYQLAAQDHIASLLREADQARRLKTLRRPNLLQKLAQRLNLVRQPQPEVEVHLA